MTTGTLALIISLCAAHTKYEISGHRERGYCEKRATACVRYYGRETIKRTSKCVDEAIDDAACAYATLRGWRTKKTSNYKWAKEFWQ